ncbi:MAG: hypothetical protein FWE27_06935, partial [Defluviitaleaceae bacterium]|nr:hypothetical protein [Defluviitaleaceae bacterium]
MTFVMVFGLLPVSAGEFYLSPVPEEYYGLPEFLTATPSALELNGTVLPMHEDDLEWSLDIGRLNAGTSDVATGGAERALIGGTLQAPTYLPGVRLRNSGTPTNSTISITHGATPRVEVRFGATNRFVEIQTGTVVGGTQDAARSVTDGFTPVPGVTYRLVFNASMGSGTGGFRMRANAGTNNNSSSDWQRVTGISTNPQQIALQWTQEANGGNIVIDNGTASNGMSPEPTASSPRTLILSDIRIYRIERSSDTGYLFQLQPHIADLPLGCIGTGTTNIAPTHELNEVTVQVRGTSGSRNLFVERTAANNTRGLLLHGIRLEQGDVVTVSGNLISGSGLRMRFQSAQTTSYLAGSDTATRTGPFTMSYTVSSEHAGRANQALRIIPWASSSDGGNIRASFQIDNITVFRMDTSTPEIRRENSAMTGTFRIENPYRNVNWTTWRQFRAAHHVHTQRSDGNSWLREAVLDHYNRGFDIIAITDHNVIDTGDWTRHPPAQPTVFWWEPMRWNHNDHLMTAADQTAIRNGTWQPGAGRSLPSGSRFSALGFIRGQMRTILGMPAGQPNVGMIGVPFSNEHSTRDHTLTYWANINAPEHWSDNEILRQTGLAGGLAVLAHPGRHTCSSSGSDRCSTARNGEMCSHAGGRGHVAASNLPREVNRYVTRFRDFPAAIGMEIYNRPDHETRSDRILWDNVLLQAMPTGRNVWGFSNDDSHSMDGTALGWNVMLMPSLTDENHRTSMETGAFYMVSRVDRRLDVNQDVSTSASSSWHAPLMNRQAPAIRNIAVTGQTITITGVNYDEILWITGNPFRANGSNNHGGGVIIETGPSINLAELGKYVWGNYVRAVLICRTPPAGHSGINSHGVALTQPFGIFPTSGGPTPTPTPSPTITPTPTPTPTPTITPTPTPTSTPTITPTPTPTPTPTITPTPTPTPTPTITPTPTPTPTPTI